MGASFIILHSAIQNRRRREEEEEEERLKKEKEEKEKIKVGYRKEYVITNQHTRYHHTYRNIQKQQRGLLIMAIATSGFFSTLIPAILMMQFSIIIPILLLVFMIMFFVGIEKYKNTVIDWSSEEKAPFKPGHSFLFTEDKVRYGYEWVKSKK